MKTAGSDSVGIYVRISRDENGENHETVENQEGLLLDYVEKNRLGHVHAVYVDDNVSGSAFDRTGLARLKDDVLNGRINIVLMKDLSRLGRNNAKTLQWIDFLEEHGVRIITGDGRYDSMEDNDTVGIETWANERYIRDISRKIRSCLRFKIQKGEYIGNAPFGYKKSCTEKNRLVIDEEEADIVRLIFRLYRSGMGYTSIAGELDARGFLPPKGNRWNRITVRRILCSRAYIGDTVQGISEKISFKSKKTRRLSPDRWVITENTHEAIISRDEFLDAQGIRESRNKCRKAGKRNTHVLGGILRCGDCGSAMYARNRPGGTAYVCGNYLRNGRKACSSHFVYEKPIIDIICMELGKIFAESKNLPAPEMLQGMETGNSCGEKRRHEINRQMETCRRHQETLYRDRLEGRISWQLFERMNRQCEARMEYLENEAKKLETAMAGAARQVDPESLAREAASDFASGFLEGDVARAAIGRITVTEGGMADCVAAGGGKNCAGGLIVIDFRF